MYFVNLRLRLQRNVNIHDTWPFVNMLLEQMENINGKKKHSVPTHTTHLAEESHICLESILDHDIQGKLRTISTHVNVSPTPSLCNIK